MICMALGLLTATLTSAQDDLPNSRSAVHWITSLVVPYTHHDPLLQFVDSDTLLVAFDDHDDLMEPAEKNFYHLALVNTRRGTVTTAREFPSRPRFLKAVVTADRHILLISNTSAEELDATLKEIRNVDFPDPVTPSTDNHPIDPVHVSLTPDRTHLEVIFRGQAPKFDAALFTILPEIAWKKEEGAPLRAEFRAGFKGTYTHTSLRGWTWSDGNHTIAVCEPCNHLEVISPSLIAISTDSTEELRSSTVAFTKQVGDAVQWVGRYRGLLESAAADSAGNRLIMLSTAGHGLFQPDLIVVATLFDGKKRKRQVIDTITVRDRGDTQGGQVLGAAISPDGSRLAIFIGGRDDGGRIGVYELPKP